MYHIVVQSTVTDISIPSPKILRQWAKALLKEKVASGEVTIRIVDKQEITDLNTTYRNKKKPTNVLSFPFELPEGVEIETPILGDIVICADIIADEAADQGKTITAHWAHMIVHGLLHLLGYDHEKDRDAEVMEQEEIRILSQLGFQNPYQISEKGD